MPERLSRAHAGTPATKRAKSHTGCGGMQALCLGGSLAWEGEGLAPGYHWRLIGMVFCGCCFVFWWPVVLVVILLLFRWLQILCASWVLSKLVGEPPRLNGMISSSSQLSGCGVLSVRSMGLPQSAQVGIGPSAAMCLVLHLRRAAPFWYLPEPALLLMIAYSTSGLVAWAGFEFAVARPLWVYCGHALAVAAVAGYGLYRTQAVAYAVGFDPATCGFGDCCSTC